MKKINKRNIISGIVIILCVHIILAPLIIDKVRWYKLQNQTMDLLGEAITNLDIEMMDELFDSECEFFTIDYIESTYCNERENIEEICNTWNTNDFDVTAYNYTSLDNPNNLLLNSAMYAFEMMIVDANGDRYKLSSTLFISRKGRFDCSITRIKLYLTANPSR